MTMNNYNQEQEQDHDQDYDDQQDTLVPDDQGCKEGQEGRLLSSLLDGVEIATGHIQRAPEGELGNTETEIEDIPGTTTLSSSSTSLSLPVDPEAPTPCSFITGRAGSGKSTLTRERCAADPFYAALSASTGIAAVNLSTITVHSLLGFFDTDSLRDAYIQGGVQRRIRKLVGEGYRNVAIDECSMISRETLDLLVRAFDDVNTGLLGEGRNPIGIILIGDLCQLPSIPDRPQGYHPTPGRRRPAIPTPWLFESQFWPRFEKNTTHLTKIWRQADQRFLAALNFARAGRGRDCVQVLQSCGQRFESFVDNDFDGTTIVGKNDEVDRINQIRLDRVKGRLIALPSRRWAVGGKVRPEWKHLPERTLLRENCYVMILANKYEEGRMVYANGDCGWVKGIQPSIDKLCPPSVLVELVRTGEVVNVESLVRGIEHGEKPDWVGGGVEWQEQGAGEDGKFLPQPHWRKSKKRYVTGQVEYYPLRVAYASTVHKCVVPETLVATPTGYTTITNIQIGDQVLGGQGWGEVIGKAVTHKRLIRLRTVRGYRLEASPDHPILTRRGFVQMQDLTPRDIVILQGSPNPGNSFADRDLPWLVGLLVGDGNYTDKRDGTIELCCIEKELWQKAADFLNTQGILLHPRKDQRGAYFISRWFRDYLLESFDMGYIKAPFKEVPRRIWSSSASNRAAFLRGLFDADGHVGTRGIVLSTASVKLAEGVQDLLMSLEIPSRLSKYTRTGPRAGSGVYYQVFINRAFCPMFAARIGFVQHKKKSALAKYRYPKPNCAGRLSKLEDAVESVLDTGVDVEMYDIEVTPDHTFVANGIVTHNCQGLSLDKVQVDIRGWQFKSTAAMTYVALSRARTLQGLRLVGTPGLLAERCKVDPKVARWL